MVQKRENMANVKGKNKNLTIHGFLLIIDELEKQ